MLQDAGIDVNIDQESCELLDSVYLPSKYPLGSALAKFEATPETCEHLLKVVERLFAEVWALLP